MNDTCSGESAFSKVQANKTESCDALARIHDDIKHVQTSNHRVHEEMTKPMRIVCDPPPITPRCHGVEDPPNPYIVDNNMTSLTKAESTLTDDLNTLGNTNQSDEFKRDFETAKVQMQSLKTETDKLYELTKNHSYDKEKVVKETITVDKLSRDLEKTANILAKDTGCSEIKELGIPIEKEHAEVFCDVKAPFEKVSSEVGNFDDLNWHPAVQSTTAEGTGTDGDPYIRKIVAKGGSPVFVEQMLTGGASEDSGYYRYRMLEGLKVPVQPIGTFRAERNPDGGTRITWEVDVDISKLDPETAQTVTKGIQGFYKDGLELLKQKFDQ